MLLITYINASVRLRDLSFNYYYSVVVFICHSIAVQYIVSYVAVPLIQANSFYRIW